MSWLPETAPRSGQAVRLKCIYNVEIVFRTGELVCSARFDSFTVDLRQRMNQLYVRMHAGVRIDAVRSVTSADVRSHSHHLSVACSQPFMMILLPVSMLSMTCLWSVQELPLNSDLFRTVCFQSYIPISHDLKVPTRVRTLVGSVHQLPAQACFLF